MNLKRIVTAPVRAVKHTKQLLDVRSAGVEELELLEAAAAHPQLYRDLTWWARLVTATRRLLELLPMPIEGRKTMNDLLLKAGIVVGGLGTIALTFQSVLTTDPTVGAMFQLLPPKYTALVLGGLAIAGKAAAFYHPAPTQSK